MTHEEKLNALDAVLQPVIEKGFDGIGDVFAALLNTAMLIERERHLNADAYERTEERRGHANGFKPRSLKTRIGELDVRVPQVRGMEPFRPSALEHGQRSEKALKLTLAEMYVQGVSTRRMKRVMETMCGFEVSSSQVSRAAKEMDVELEKWRSRPVGCVAAVPVPPAAQRAGVRHRKGPEGEGRRRHQECVQCAFSGGSAETAGNGG